MSHEIIKELKERSTKFLNWIELNVEDENVIKSAIAFFEFEDSALKAIIKMAEIDLAVVNTIDLQNTSLTALLRKYNTDTPFNKERAKKRFKKGLEMIITEDYQYNGMYYTKGTTKTWD